MTPYTEELDLAWAGPSARLRSVRRTQVGAVVVVGAVIALAAGLASGSLLSGGIATGALVVLGLALDLLIGRRVRSWGFSERHDDLLVRRGVMIRRLSVIPYGRMQYVDVTAGPFERIFGLATVRMHTAAAASDARIPGLAAADATRLRDQLAALGEAKATGL